MRKVLMPIVFGVVAFVTLWWVFQPAPRRAPASVSDDGQTFAERAGSHVPPQQAVPSQSSSQELPRPPRDWERLSQEPGWVIDQALTQEDVHLLQVRLIRGAPIARMQARAPAEAVALSAEQERALLLESDSESDPSFLLRAIRTVPESPYVGVTTGEGMAPGYLYRCEVVYSWSRYLGAGEQFELVVSSQRTQRGARAELVELLAHGSELCVAVSPYVGSDYDQQCFPELQDYRRTLAEGLSVYRLSYEWNAILAFADCRIHDEAGADKSQAPLLNEQLDSHDRDKFYSAMSELNTIINWRLQRNEAAPLPLMQHYLTQQIGRYYQQSE